MVLLKRGKVRAIHTPGKQHGGEKSTSRRSCQHLTTRTIRPHPTKGGGKSTQRRQKTMPLKDLQRMLNGALLKGLYTAGEFIEYCNKHNLKTNADKLKHFAN